MAITVTPVEALQILILNIRAGLVTFMRGSPGTAKSALVKLLAKEYNLKLIDLRMAQCDPTDFLGFPHVNEANGKASYIPMDTFPLEGDPLPLDENGKQMNGWLLHLDEFNSADRNVQKAAYKTLEGVIGNTPMHKNVAIVACGNLDTDGAIVEDLSSALRSRLAHLTIRPDHASWMAYAENAGYDQRILSFLQFKPACLYTFDPERAEIDGTYACYRTWEFADKLLKLMVDVDTNPTALASFAGLVSEGVAREFLAFLRMHNKLPTVGQIVANPDKILMTTEPGTLYALSGSLGQNANASNIGPMMTYINRMPMEFQVITLRGINRNDPSLIQAPAMQDWMKINGKELV